MAPRTQPRGWSLGRETLIKSRHDHQRTPNESASIRPLDAVFPTRNNGLPPALVFHHLISYPAPPSVQPRIVLNKTDQEQKRKKQNCNRDVRKLCNTSKSNFNRRRRT